MGEAVSTFVPALTRTEVEGLPARAREVVEYRKSGLSLNHIQGCPLDCAYCIRHTYGLWDHRTPRALMPDAKAVEQIVTHRYFRAHITPLQILNRATDPFLPAVRPHTLAVLRDLDGHRPVLRAEVFDRVGTSLPTSSEDGIPEILAEQRLGHEVPGMRGLYAHVSDQMRDDLKAALQVRWEDSLRT